MLKRFLFSLSLLFVPLSSLFAQPPAPPNPQAPTLAPVVPLGMARGSSLDVTLTGTNLIEPTGVWTSFPAKVTIPTDGGNGKVATSLKIKLDVPKDASLGFHSIRVATKRGMSNARLFCIDELPQITEAATNRDAKTAQVLPLPCCLVGRADAELTDYFKITVKAEQRLSFEVLGRRLGSAFDPQLTLIDAASGEELPNGHSNDAPGLQTDCRLSYTFKKAGDVLITIRDVSFRGGADFHYRLRMGDFPCATTPLPLAVKRGSKTSVNFAGPHVDGVAAVEVQAPPDPTVSSVQVAPKGATSGLHGWPVVLHLSDLDEHLEKEPNSEAAKAQRLVVPCAVTGRFEEKDDADHYVFNAKKGQRFIIEGHTVEHLSPSEVYLVLKDAKGTQLLATNPMNSPRLDFTAAVDGDFTLSVEHLHSWGGPDEVYRVTITPFQQAFSLTLAIDRWDVGPGSSVSIPVFAQRTGYAGAIEVSVLGPKGVTGTVTIPAGPVKPPNVPSANLEVKVDDSLSSGPISFAIQGKATIDGKPVTQLASVRALVTTAFGNLAVPPRETFTRLGLAITEKPPFSLAVQLEGGAAGVPGKPVTATVKATRQAGFTGEIVLALVGPTPGITIVPAKIVGTESSGKLTLNLAPGAKPGAMALTVQGTAKHGGRDWIVRGAPVTLTIKK